MQEISRDFLRSRYQCVTLWTCHNYYGITKRFSPSCVARPVTTINYLLVQRMRQSHAKSIKCIGNKKKSTEIPAIK